MARIPLFSLYFIIIGFFIGAIADNERVGFILASVGSIAGYIIWLKSRTILIKSGKIFSIGSVINTLLCTFCAIGFAFYGIAESQENSYLVIIPATAYAIWVQLQAGRKAGTARLLPTSESIIHEIKETLPGASTITNSIQLIKKSTMYIKSKINSKAT